MGEIVKLSEHVIEDAKAIARPRVHMACSTCGCAPCVNPTFCASCREADARQLRRQPAQRLRIVKDEGVASAEELQRDYEATLRRCLADGLPQATIDALEYLLRQHDPERLRACIAQHSSRERELIADYLTGKCQ